MAQPSFSVFMRLLIDRIFLVWRSSVIDAVLAWLPQVMSDEFEIEGRSFNDGHDPMWTSTTHSDDAQTAAGRGSLQYYNASYGTTTKGMEGCWEERNRV